MLSPVLIVLLDASSVVVPTLDELGSYLPVGGAEFAGFFLEAFAWGFLSSAFAWLVGFGFRWAKEFLVPSSRV